MSTLYASFFAKVLHEERDWCSGQGSNWGGGSWKRAPPPALHTLTKDMSLIEEQHMLHLN